MSRLFCALWLLLWPLAVSAQDVPAPLSDTISDYVGVLTDAQRAELQTELESTRAQTGVQVVAIIYPRQADLAPNMSFEDFATAWFNNWRIGDAQRNDGVMILLLTEDRRVRIALGRGYDSTWDRVARGVINEHMTPPLAENDWYAGLAAGIQQVHRQIAQPFSMDQTQESDRSSWTVMAIVAGVLGLSFGGNLLLDLLRKCPQCGTRGTLKIQRQTLRAATSMREGQQRVTTTCTNCGYHDVRTQIIDRKTQSRGSSGGGGSSSGGGASGRF